jgi:cystathionine beta-lyase
MLYDFDRVIDRRHSDSSKWNYYSEDVLPLWTADMDFRVAEPVIEALHARVKHGIFGYTRESAELREVIRGRLARLYDWHVPVEAILFQPGVVLGFNRVCRIAGSPGDGILVQPPVYPPILAAPPQNGMERQTAALERAADGTWHIDFDTFESRITERTRLFILCNPHNPTGRAFRRDELERIAEICLRRDVLICSDEIHCDILFAGSRHVPVASLDPEIARRSITLMAPSKTFNIPGLHCSVAVVTDPELRRLMQKPEPAFFPEVNALGFTAALAAYRDGGEWLEQVLRYLEANRDLVCDYVAREMAGIEVGKPEATYLAWLDCRRSGIQGDPYRFFLERARVALSPGPSFGRPGEGFGRLNFACPRATLLAALGRMKAALQAGQPGSGETGSEARDVTGKEMP